MLSGGVYLSAAINLLIAVYLVFFYPRTVQRQFRNQPLPPLFRLLLKVVPIAGYLLAAGTLLYMSLLLAGLLEQR